uniref:Uncharacterized protein n=1 Tax=Heterorhabditis bacteriophora TaxID=37862 RepID=A0A1I7WI56_HETBA
MIMHLNTISSLLVTRIYTNLAKICNFYFIYLMSKTSLKSLTIIIPIIDISSVSNITNKQFKVLYLYVDQYLSKNFDLLESVLMNNDYSSIYRRYGNCRSISCLFLKIFKLLILSHRNCMEECDSVHSFTFGISDRFISSDILCKVVHINLYITAYIL